MHQLTFQLDIQPPPKSDIAALLAAPAVPLRRESVRERLMGELESIERKKTRISDRQLELRSIKSKLETRATAIIQQLESLDRNPLAILRHQSSLVPEHLRGDLWFYRPVSDLRLERLSGMGARALTILSDFCPTVGALELTRVHEGLTSIRGIGKRRAAMIEARLLKWLDHNAYGYRPAASFEHRGAVVTEMPREIVL